MLKAEERMELVVLRKHGTSIRELARLAMPKLLIIDEIGYLPFGREQANLLSRWSHGKTVCPL